MYKTRHFKLVKQVQISFGLKLNFFPIRGVAWSNGQRRGLPLQRLWDRILVFLYFSFFLAIRNVRLQMRAEKKRCENKTQEWRDGEKNRQAFHEDAERRWFASKAIKWLTPSKAWWWENYASKVNKVNKVK